MEKGFLKGKSELKKLSILILLLGSLITIILGVSAWKETNLKNGNELIRYEAGEGSYEQKLTAVDEEGRNYVIEITVEEQKLTKAEAEKQLIEAEGILEKLLLGENESLKKISTNLKFVSQIPDTCVEVYWSDYGSAYFRSDGTRKEDLDILEPTEVKLSAELSCQEYSRQYETMVVLMPRKHTPEKELSALVEKSMEEEGTVLQLPKDYAGNALRWKKPIDLTFLYFAIFTAGTFFVLKAGAKRDQELERKKQLEIYEREYAEIVSKFTMLLSAGLSVRNAWERIVSMNKKEHSKTASVYREMEGALLKLQKGVPELEVYEEFGRTTGLIHYKKLMALFIQEKRRGSTNLLEAMNQEMLQAWEERKRKTRQQGEKMGTMLLLPMMGMLGVVFVIILVPAFLSFQI